MAKGYDMSSRGAAALLASLLSVLMPGRAIAPPIDIGLARQYFEEAQALCSRDNGLLWGINLAGPIIFADPQTRTAVANQPDQEGKLVRKEGVYLGIVPSQLNIANTSIAWGGVKWTMIVWPLPADRKARASLMGHELWHRLQDQIGLPASNPANSHLDSLEGRVWLQLEWRALKKAITVGGAERRRAIEDALVLRAYRRQLFPKAGPQERALEMNEGLAEYTGIKLSSSSNQELVRSAVNEIEEANNRRSFVRSFAYVSGPAYGILLDDLAISWRHNLRPDDDLGGLLQRSLSIDLPQNLRQSAQQVARNYQGEALRASETKRENKRAALVAEYRERLVDGPVLIIPLRMMSVQFDPNNLVPLDDLGTVYPTIRVSDAWGVLTVSGGALLAANWTEIRVAAPADTIVRPLKGEGWSLDLKEGWVIQPAERKGDFVLKPTP